MKPIFTFPPPRRLAEQFFHLRTGKPVRITGATAIYNTSSAGWGCSGTYNYTPIMIDGQAKVTLSAPTTGPLTGVVLFGDRNGCSTPGTCVDNINGQASATFSGALYFKSDEVLFNGSSTTDGCMGVVADTITINGNSNFGSQGCSINPIAVTVTPQSVGMYGGQTQTFTAAVTNTNNSNVSWSISPSGTGSINSAGVYTAPSLISSIQTVTVTATSQADPGVSGTATITLFPPSTISINPTSATLYGGQQAQFSAAVTNALDTTVTWSLSPSGIGTLTSSGGSATYTAPASIAAQQNVTVTAASHANPALTASATVTLIPPATPTITWASPAAITYGTALSGTQLDASANAPGTLSYSASAGTVLSAGSHTLTLTFTPTNPALYSTATATVTLTVNQATPTIAWAAPTSINYGTALSAAQLDATANVPGTFVYSPANGAILQAGTQALSVTFTPTDSADYTTATATVTLTVNQVASPISVSIAPGSATLHESESLSFTATVTNASDTSVYWTLNSAGTGLLSEEGVYTAPASIAAQQTVTVTATSRADSTKSASATVTLSPGQCNSNGYGYFRAITVDHTKVPNTDQASFPFLFETTDPAFKSTSNGGHVSNANGYDIIFTSDAAGNNVLPFEQESYNPSTGAVIYWINVATLSHSTDTIIYLRYGNPSVVTSQQNTGGVWNSNYLGVWHLPNGTTLSAADSTSNGHNGTVIGATASSGKIDGAASFNGSSYIDVGGLGNFPPQGTIDFWMNPSTITSYPNAFTTNYNGGNNAIRFEEDGSGDFGVAIGDGIFNGYGYMSGTMVANNWYHVTLTWDTTLSTATGYLNGAQVFAANSSSVWPSSIADLAIGSGYNTGRDWQGLIDEVRISNATHTADWIAAEYNNQSSPSTFYSLSPENISVTPTAVNLYAQQSQQFSATLPDTCNSTVFWSMPAGSPGILSASGLYTAPASITSVETVAITATSQSDSSLAQSATVTLLPPFQNTTLSLSAFVQPPYAVGASEMFSATFKNQDGTPISNALVTFTVSGVDNSSGNSTTNNSGVATFSYSGAASGTDTIQASANGPSGQATSNKVLASWVVPSSSMSTTSALARFYPLTGECCWFNAPPTSTPLFEQVFPTINFDPPSGAIPGDTTINTNTRPFTDVTVDPSGNFSGTIVAQGNGYQAGSGVLTGFQVAFTGSFVVANAGNVEIPIFVDNSFILGIGGGATRVSGPMDSGAPSTTPLEQFPVVGAVSTSIGGASTIVYFPGPGTYNYELDYVEDGIASLSLMMMTGNTGGNGLAPGVLSGGTLTLSPSSVQAQPVGGQQTFTVTATDAAGNPVSNLSVGLVVSAHDNQEQAQTTNSAGVTTFSYVNKGLGTDQVQAVAIIDGMVAYSNIVYVPWTQASSTTTGTGGSGTLNISIDAPNTVILPGSLQLSGTVADSGLQSGQTIATTWSLVSGPGNVTFGNPSQIATTASFSEPGGYVLELSASDPDASGSAQITVTVDPQPQTTQGWIGSPADGAQVTGIVPITVASGETLSSFTLTYYPASAPTSVTVLNTQTNANATGQIGSLDTTTLANGQYWITLQATDTNGNSSYNLALVSVIGNYKPGRVTSTVTDLVVPAKGLAIQIQRTYDSLNAGTSSDFGYGWNLGTTVNLTVNPRGSVTFTLNGQRKTFYLTPQYDGFLPYYVPAFTPEPGMHGTLTQAGSGCADFFDYLVPDGSLWACVGGGFWTPPGYVYTDPSGTAYTMTATGQLQSIVDKNGNTLTITSAGITSSTGLVVSFERDSNGRITQITDPTQQNVYLYGYDSNGNLVSVTYPNTSISASYTYFPGTHYYESGTDFLNNPLPSTTYYGPTDTDSHGNSLNNRLATVTDAIGEKTSYAYDLTTNTTTVTYPPDCGGNVGTATMVYDTMGDLLSSIDPLGHKTTNTYDANQNLLSMTDPLSHTTCYTYDASGNRLSTSYPAVSSLPSINCSPITNTTIYNQYSEPTQTVDELGNLRTFNYDVNFNPQSVSDALGTLASFTFNVDGTMQAGAIGFNIAANPSQASQFNYDANGNLASRTDALGRTTSYTYNSLGQKVTMVEPLLQGTSSSAATTTYNYDPFGNLTETDAPLGRTTKSSYDGNGNKKSDTDPLLNVTNYTYDPLNRLIRTDYPDHTYTKKTYDFRGNVVDEWDQANNQTHHVYDLAGRETSVTQAYGTQNATTTNYTYYYDGRKETETDNLSHTTTYTYGVAGDLIGVSGPNGNFSYGYDNAHNRTSMTDGNDNTTQYGYDARKRLATTTYADGTSKTNTYDGPGNLDSVTDQNGNLVQYTYDAANQLQSVVQTNSPNAPNNITSYSYDPLGNLIGLNDANSHLTESKFDLLSEQQSKTLPDGTLTETRQYDAAGNLTSLTHFNGKTTTYTYDSLNRLLSRKPDPTTGEPTVSFTYTATGKRATMADAISGTTNYYYDSMDRLTQKQTPEGTLNYSYGAAGHVASMTSSHTNGTSVSYTYDSLNRLSTVVDARLSGNQTTTYGYDSASNVTAVTYPNGVKYGFNYDQLNRLKQIATQQTGYLYTLDNAGNRKSGTELSGRTSNWTYDGIYRLTNETISLDPNNKNGTASYGLDPVGNRLTETSTVSGINSASFSFDQDDQLIGVGHDGSGNTTQAGANSYSYDTENRLVSMNGGAVTIVYDGDGNRVEKIVGGVATQYLVDDLNPTGYAQVVEELTAGAVTRSYTYGLQRISQNQVISNTWTPSFYGYDGFGTVRQLTNSSGTITDTYDYDGFGNKINSTGSTPNNYLYRGEQYDSDIGLYYLRARYYNPITGRFMSRDPEDGHYSDPKTLHKYLYAAGDPVNRVDPLGREDYEFELAEEPEESKSIEIFGKTVKKEGLCYEVYLADLNACFVHVESGPDYALCVGRAQLNLYRCVSGLPPA